LNEKSKVLGPYENYYLSVTVRIIHKDVTKYWNETINDWTYNGTIAWGWLNAFGIVFYGGLVPIIVPVMVGPIPTGSRREFSKKVENPPWKTFVTIIPLDETLYYYKLWVIASLDYTYIVNNFKTTDIQNYLIQKLLIT
jgi:hypothetical protein